MTLQTTPAEREELKRLEAAATEAPWYPCGAKYGPAITAGGELPDDFEAADQTDEQREIGWVFGVSCDSEPICDDEDKALMISARNIIVRLLADIEALVAENERLKDERDEFDICPKCGHEFKVKP